MGCETGCHQGLRMVGLHGVPKHRGQCEETSTTGVKNNRVVHSAGGMEKQQNPGIGGG